MTRRRGRGTSNTVPTVLMIGFALLVLAGIAILVTKDWDDIPSPPPITYEERPEGKGSGDSWLDHTASRPRRSGATEPGAAPGEAPAADAPSPELLEEAVDAAYFITGTVTDERTDEPVGSVQLLASRLPTTEEEERYKARDREVMENRDSDAIESLIAEKQRLWADAGTNTSQDGTFKIPIVHAGEYKLTVLPQNYLRKTIDKTFVGETRPEWKVDIALELGATISGRITDAFDNQGIDGLTVNATLDQEHYSYQAVTAEDGTYTVSGLGPGAYSVIADIERTPYRVTKVLPFRKTTVSGPDQEVRGIDFKLDRGGIVWGHVTTPDGEPVQAQVFLCTSQSVMSQALSAMVQQAPPLSDGSAKEDGYYELVGVPLNEEWRVYATSDTQAPTLTRPFIVTERNKTVRVPIEIAAGTSVYGQVVDSKGKGVPDARIMCLPSYSELMAPMESAKALREDQSDADGYFTLEELPAGYYQVMAHKEGYKYALKGTELYSNGYRDVENFRVVLENIEAGNYEVFGTVMDAAGRPVSEARVVLSGIGTETLQGVGREATTDNSGDFRFEGIEIGTYVLNVTKGGYSPKTVNKVLLDEQNNVLLEAASIVRGRVLLANTNQAPENGYTVGAVQLEGMDDGSERNFFSMLSDLEYGEEAQEFNNPDGRYELSLAAGTWRLEGRAARLAPARKEITLLPGDVIDDVDLILTNEGSSIEGYVRVSDGQSPQGATVSLVEADSPSQALTFFAQGGGGQHSTLVADDGVFHFDQLPSGTYYAVARHPAYPQAMSPVIMLEENDQATGVEVLMGPGGTLRGYVFDNGQPASGWVVTVIANGQPYTGTSDQSGAYEITNIPEGTFQAFATNPDIIANLSGEGGQGYPVEIWSGSVTVFNFGEFEGITVNVTVHRPPGSGSNIPSLFENPLARVYLNPADVIPAIGEKLPADGIPGTAYTVGSGATVTLPNVAIGAWRVDYYRLDTAGLYTWRGMQDFQVTGEEPEVFVDLVVN